MTPRAVQHALGYHQPSEDYDIASRYRPRRGNCFTRQVTSDSFVGSTELLLFDVSHVTESECGEDQARATSKRRTHESRAHCNVMGTNIVPFSD